MVQPFLGWRSWQYISSAFPLYPFWLARKCQCVADLRLISFEMEFWLNSSNRCCCKICFSGFLLKAILRGSFTTLPVVQSIHLIPTYRLFSIKWRQQISSLNMTSLPLQALILENSKQLFSSPLLDTEARSKHSDHSIFSSNASSRLIHKHECMTLLLGKKGNGNN